MKINRQLVPRIIPTLFGNKKVFVMLTVASLSILFALVIGMTHSRPVKFSYSTESCIWRPTVLPRTFSLTGKTTFSIRYRGGSLLATRTCFIAEKPLVEGNEDVIVRRFGIGLLSRRYRVIVPVPPRASLVSSKENVSLVKPLTYKLDALDRVHSYQLVSGDKRASCVAKNTAVTCVPKSLGLSQGASSEVRLERTLKGISAGTATATTLHILPATTITEASVQDGQTVFAKLRGVDFKTDKPLDHAVAKLFRRDGDRETPVTVKTTVDGAAASVTAAEDLPRETQFRLVFDELTATDGSTLDGGYSLSFTTSGGPKVADINIGHANVAGQTTVAVRLDQPLKPGQDIGRLVTSEGIGSSVSYEGDTVYLRLAPAGLCTAFTVSVKAGVVGENDAAGKEAWRFDSRLVCHTVANAGYSVRGRAIPAYYFGSSGPTVLFTGTIHGNETSAYSTLMQMVNYLDSNPTQIPVDRRLVIVPVINPDGMASASRYNANSVNLDRNFPTSDWSTDIQIAGGTIKKGGGGSAPLSEPEARAVANLTSSLSPRLEVSFHAYGSLVGSGGCGASDSLARQYAATSGYGTMIGNAEEVMGYSFTGEYETWMCQKLGVPSVLVELPSHSGGYFTSNRAAIWKMIEY